MVYLGFKLWNSSGQIKRQLLNHSNICIYDIDDIILLIQSQNNIPHTTVVVTCFACFINVNLFRKLK